MLHYTIEEHDKRILLTLHELDVEQLRTVMQASNSRYESATLPRVSIEFAEQTKLGFYPDEIRISIGPDAERSLMLSSFQVLRFDEMLGQYSPITIKKRNERLARIQRVRSVLETFKQEMSSLGVAS
jgi:hypothetical protein